MASLSKVPADHTREASSLLYCPSSSDQSMVCLIIWRTCSVPSSVSQTVTLLCCCRSNRRWPPLMTGQMWTDVQWLGPCMSHRIKWKADERTHFFPNLFLKWVTFLCIISWILWYLLFLLQNSCCSWVLVSPATAAGFGKVSLAGKWNNVKEGKCFMFEHEWTTFCLSS